jgi:hypothetical protein
MGLTQAEVYDNRWMKDIGAPERSLSAERRSKARQALTANTGVQQRKKRQTMTRSMRITRFLAIRLQVELLLHTRFSLDLLLSTLSLLLTVTLGVEGGLWRCSPFFLAGGR